MPAVLQFLVDHVQRTTEDGALTHDLPVAIDQALNDGGFKTTLGAPALNTVLHRLAVLSKAHQLREVANPARDPARPGVGPARAPRLCRARRATRAQDGHYPKSA